MLFCYILLSFTSIALGVLEPSRYSIRTPASPKCQKKDTQFFSTDNGQLPYCILAPFHTSKIRRDLY